jgi:hypothetical protein
MVDKPGTQQSNPHRTEPILPVLSMASDRPAVNRVQFLSSSLFTLIFRLCCGCDRFEAFQYLYDFTENSGTIALT